MLAKTINDIEEMVKREMSMERRTSLKDRLKIIKADHEQIKQKFAEVKQAIRERQRNSEKDALLAGYTPSPILGGSQESRQMQETMMREKESRSLDYSSTRVDEYIQIGLTTLENLKNQRITLKVSKRIIIFRPK